MIYTRYLIGGAFVFAGVIKAMGHRFTTESGADAPIDTAWHFFETMYRSGLYWQFLGWGQIVTGGLLMTQRYARLGALLNMPVIANVFVVTISYDFGGTPVITGAMLMANMMLLVWEAEHLGVLVDLPPAAPEAHRHEQDLHWAISGLALFSFTALYRYFQPRFDIFAWFGTCVLIGFPSLVWGIWQYYHKKNNTLASSQNI